MNWQEAETSMKAQRLRGEDGDGKRERVFGFASLFRRESICVLKLRQGREGKREQNSFEILEIRFDIKRPQICVRRGYSQPSFS